MGVTYISWAPHCSRSDHTARELGGTSHAVYWEALGSHPLTVWLKYLGQSLRTWRILSSERPATVFVMTPPVFAPLIVWLWCETHGAKLVLDAHTAAFLHPRWRWFQSLQFWLARRAATTIVHNPYLKELVERNGAHATVVPDVPVRFGEGTYSLAPGFNVAVVCSFNPDEPLDAIFDAARRLPGVQFHVTGNPKALPARFRERLPANVTLTGFLPDPAYGALIRNAGAVMTLTTRDHTMLRGAWEAAYQGTPVIVSDWPILRQAFDAEAALHVDNTAEAIVRAVTDLREHPARYREGASRLRERKVRGWQNTRQVLRSRIDL